MRTNQLVDAFLMADVVLPSRYCGGGVCITIEEESDDDDCVYWVGEHTHGAVEYELDETGAKIGLVVYVWVTSKSGYMLEKSDIDFEGDIWLSQMDQEDMHFFHASYLYNGRFSFTDISPLDALFNIPKLIDLSSKLPVEIKYDNKSCFVKTDSKHYLVVKLDGFAGIINELIYVHTWCIQRGWRFNTNL